MSNRHRLALAHASMHEQYSHGSSRHQIMHADRLVFWLGTPGPDQIAKNVGWINSRAAAVEHAAAELKEAERQLKVAGGFDSDIGARLKACREAYAHAVNEAIEGMNMLNPGEQEIVLREMNKGYKGYAELFKKYTGVGRTAYS